MNKSLFECPSYGKKPNFDANAPGMHYSYRYNSRRVITYRDATIHPKSWSDLILPPGNLLGDPTRGWRVLFSDAVFCRRDSLYRIVLTDAGYSDRRWSHEQGGHMTTHSGETFWMNNIAPKAGLEPYVAGWPFRTPWYNCGYTNGGWGPGLDDYVKDR